VFFNDGAYLVKFHKCEELIQLFKVAVVDIYPELIELVYACAMRREVDSAALGFSELSVPVR
jgi:hypothetical protein